MVARILWFHLAVSLTAQWALAQAPAATAQADSAAPSEQTGPAPQPAAALRSSITREVKGDGILPNAHGQVWREYDISPYTSRVTSVAKPEQAVVDWILRETGTEIWFTEPLGILSATRNTLRVYHTPETQQVVRDILDRFNNSEAESHVFSLRLMTVDNPNWRSRALPLMQPVSVQSPGVDAWLVSKENAAVLLAELRKRADFREHGAPNLLLHNGQSQSLSRLRPRSFKRSVRFNPAAPGGVEAEAGQINEGYALTISPLLSLDEQSVDAVIKCDIDQVERFVPVNVDLPGFGGAAPRFQVQVAQMVSWRLHERFRWPTNQVLLLSCGVVAAPGPERSTILGVTNFLDTSPGRADALLFIESQGKASQTLIDPQRTAGATSTSRGRY